MTQVLTVNIDKCQNCGVCERACAERHGGKARLKVKDVLQSRGLMFDEMALPQVCKQCENPACIAVCKPKALTLEKGVVYLDEEKCIGCGRCAKSCPFSAIFIDEEPGPLAGSEREPSAFLMIFSRKPTGDQSKSKRKAKVVRKARKCDRCKGFENMACVDVCYYKALSFKDLEAITHKGRKEHKELLRQQLTAKHPAPVTET